MPGIGSKSYIQIGTKEGTYGNFVTPTKKLEVVSWSIAPNIGVIPDPSLYSAQSRRSLYQGGLTYKGSFVLRLNYEGMLELFRGVFGTGSSTLVGGETTVRDHVFKEGATLNTYSFEVILGDVPTNKCFRLLGAKLTGLNVKATASSGADGMLTAEFTVIAKDYMSDQTPTGSLSFPTAYPVLFHQASTIDDGTADAPKVRSFEVSLDNPHVEDRFYLGSVNIDEPLRSDFLTARFRITEEFSTKTAFDAARGFSSGSPQLIFQGASIGSASKQEFELRMGSAKLVELSQPLEGPSIIIATLTWEGFYDASDLTALYARFRNTEAALA